MTTGEYVQLREVFLHGGMVERINHATSMSERQFREFVQRLDLPYSESLACETWQMLAREGARRLEDVAGVEECSSYTAGETKEPSIPWQEFDQVKGGYSI